MIHTLSNQSGINAVYEVRQFDTEQSLEIQTDRDISGSYPILAVKVAGDIVVERKAQIVDEFTVKVALPINVTGFAGEWNAQLVFFKDENRTGQLSVFPFRLRVAESVYYNMAELGASDEELSARMQAAQNRFDAMVSDVSARWLATSNAWDEQFETLKTQWNAQIEELMDDLRTKLSENAVGQLAAAQAEIAQKANSVISGDNNYLRKKVETE